MYEDSDEEHKPDGTEQANLAATKYKTEALEKIKARILNAVAPKAAPNGGGVREMSERLDELDKMLPPTHVEDPDAEMFKHKKQSWDMEEAREIEYYKRRVAEEADAAAAAAKLTELEIERNRRLMDDLRKHHTGRGKLRPVTISEYANHHPGTQVVGKGRFHQWGVDVDHSDSGSGTYSIAIVEMEDGTVQSVAIDLIKFEDQ